MSKHTAHAPQPCFTCGTPTKDLIFDRRDSNLKCQSCFDKGICIEKI